MPTNNTTSMMHDRPSDTPYGRLNAEGLVGLGEPAPAREPSLSGSGWGLKFLELCAVTATVILIKLVIYRLTGS